MMPSRLGCNDKLLNRLRSCDSYTEPAINLVCRHPRFSPQERLR
jgi:hypothetical protein